VAAFTIARLMLLVVTGHLLLVRLPLLLLLPLAR